MPPQKRPAYQESAKIMKRKKEATQQPTPVITLTNEPENDFLISVKLPSKFNIFPGKLRERLVINARNSLRTRASNIETNTVPEIGQPHSIIEARGFKGSCNAFKNISCKEYSTDVSFANKEFLVWALVKFAKILNAEKFVELDPPKDKDLVPNPSFVHWHSVRHGEIG